MKRNRKILSIIMAVALAVSILAESCLFSVNRSVMAVEVIKTGICGDNADWNFNTETGVLTITGSGDMYDNPNFSGLGIKKVVIGEGITSVGKDSFISKTTISTVIFPSTLKKIGSWAFWGCESISEFSIPASVEYIGDVAFEKCTSLKRIFVESLNENYMSEDGILYSKDKKELVLYPPAKAGTSFSIPQSVETISLYAFDYNQNLKTLFISDNVKTLGGEKPFTGVVSLANINISGGNQNYTSIDGNVYSKDNTKLIKYAPAKQDEEFTVPDGVTSIADRACQNCSYLKNIIIPDSVVSIGKDAFDLSVKITACKDSAAYNYAINYDMELEIMEEKAVTSIEIVQLPKKVTFAVGDNYNNVGMVVKLNYSDGTYGLRSNGFIIQGFDSENIGKCTITVIYGGFQAEYQVDIVESIVPEKIVSGQNATVDIVESGQIYYMNFVPDKTGEYTFESNSGSDTYAIIYDESGNIVARGDDTDTSSDFSVTYRFEEGKEYVIAVGYAYEEEIGSFEISATYVESEEESTQKPNEETTTVSASEEITTVSASEETTSSNVSEETTEMQNPTWKYEERTTTAKVVVANTKIKSAVKKKASNTVKISLKKVKNAKAYQIQISTDKKFKKTLVSKKVKKVSLTLKSSKLKNKKKLYIRARAIKVVDKKSYTGKWTKPKAIKIKK